MTSTYIIILVNTIVVLYPKSILPKICGKPSRNQILKTHQQLCNYATLIATSIGDGHHGYLALYNNLNNYRVSTGIPVVAPHNPGKFSPKIPENLMETQI